MGLAEGFVKGFQSEMKPGDMKQRISHMPWEERNLRTGGLPGQMAPLVGVLSLHAKAERSILVQGTYKNQPLNAQVSGTTHQCFSLSTSSPLSKQMNKTETDFALMPEFQKMEGLIS